MSRRLVAVLLLILVARTALGAQVYELNDKFLDLHRRPNSQWLVKFYAPWCHFCKQLEPVYEQVAQQLASQASPVVVGRLDCTRWTSAAKEFPVRGFPTILFIDGDLVIEYDGERSKEEIVEFATRLSGPLIRSLPDCQQVDPLLDQRPVYFLHVGHHIPSNFSRAASKYRSICWFYYLNATSCPTLEAGTHVIKGTRDKRLSSRFQETTGNLSLNSWIRREMFPVFVKVTPTAMSRIMRSGEFW